MKYIWILAIILLAVVLFFLLRRKSDKQELAGEAEAKEVFLGNVKSFSGNFQPLFMAVAEKNDRLAKKLLETWKKRIAEHPALDRYFDGVCSSNEDPLAEAEAWLKVLEKWGVLHDTVGSIFSITKENELLYQFDDVYPMGAEAKVIRPAWWLPAEDRLISIETGVAEIQ